MINKKFISIDKFHEIIDITETDDKFDLMLDVNTSIIISKDTKLCIFNRLSSEFKMILPDQLELNNHLFVSFRHI